MPTATTTNLGANTWSVVAGSIVGNACTPDTNRTRDASAGSTTAINRRESPIVAEFGPNSGIANRNNAGASGGINSPGSGSPVGQLASSFVASFVDRGIDAALNGGSLRDVFTGSINDALSGVLNDALSQLPPEIAGIFQQAFGDLTSALSGGLTGTTQPFEPPVARDTFLQGLQGSLSDVLAGGSNQLASQLPTTVGNLLNSTSLTGALGGIAENLGSNLGANIGSSLGNALGGMTTALGDAAGQLASGLGDAISNIPGIGPAIQNFTSAVGNFGTNLNTAFNGLPTAGQAIVGAAIGAVGSNLLCNPPKKPRISEENQNTVRKDLTFNDNPAGNCDTIASAAKDLDNLVYPVTKNNVFADVANKSKIAGQELRKCIRYNDGSYSFINTVDTVNANINNSFAVKNNTTVALSQTFEQTLSQNYLDIYQTNKIIVQEQYGSLGESLYSELISDGKPLTPETKQYYTELQSTGQVNTFMSYVTQFLNVYRRSRVLR